MLINGKKRDEILNSSNKIKAFTLIEMLSVIVILSVLALIVVPLVNRSFTTSVDDLYNEQMETLVNAAKNWSTDHLSRLPNSEGEKVEVSLSELETGGYVKKGLRNPRTRKNFASGTRVAIVHLSGNYDYVPIDGNNLVLNPNQGTSDWSGSMGTGGIHKRSAVNKNGINAFQYKVTTITTSSNPWAIALKSIDLSKLQAGEKYILEFDIHSTNAFKIEVNIRNSNATQKLNTASISASIPANKDTHVKGEFTINTTEITSQLLYFSSFNRLGEYTFWNVELYQK